jgi:hypothetical protein
LQLDTSHLTPLRHSPLVNSSPPRTRILPVPTLDLSGLWRAHIPKHSEIQIQDVGQVQCPHRDFATSPQTPPLATSSAHRNFYKETMELDPSITAVFKKTQLEFYLNGTRIQLLDPNPQWTLLDFIRSQHGLKGTKLGCGEGGCGACTVVIQTLDTSQERSGRVKHLAVNACLFPLIGGGSVSFS